MRGEGLETLRLRELIFFHAATEPLCPTRLKMAVIIIVLILVVSLQELCRIPAFLIVHNFVAPFPLCYRFRERSRR
jgi:hypothetical protein